MGEQEKKTVGFLDGVRTHLFFSFVIFFSVVFFFLLSPSFAHAASLYLSPASGTYNKGASFSVGVYISTPVGSEANAVSGTLSFPTDKLEVSSVSTSGSIMSLWVQEPSFSNSAGTVSFEGVILNPGFAGNSGKVVTVSFKAKSVDATAATAFSSGSILANDGLGTNILTSFGSGSYKIGGEPPAETPVTPPEPVTAVPGAPTISSSTHSSPDAWYSNNDPQFAWSMPRSVTGVNVLANQSATTDPGTLSDGVMSRYTYTDVDDGIWYFHVRLQNEKGWGPVSHFRFQIDTVGPAPFTVTLPDSADPTVTEPRVVLPASSDADLAYYVFRLNELEVGRLLVSEIPSDRTYKLKGVATGENILVVEAVDRAGNITSTTQTFTSVVKGVEPDVTVPEPEKERGFDSLLSAVVAFVQYGLVGILLLVTLGSVLYVAYLGLIHLHHAVAGYRRRHGGGVAALTKSLKTVRSHLRQDIERLEGTRRMKGVSEGSERIIRKLSKNLQELERDIEKDIDHLSS